MYPVSAYNNESPFGQTRLMYRFTLYVCLYVGSIVIGILADLSPKN